jgi:hypothetical protein
MCAATSGAGAAGAAGADRESMGNPAVFAAMPALTAGVVFRIA